MDRLSNVELRTAIRETEKTVGVTVGVTNKEACKHLATLRMVERNRATALLAAAREKETREPKPGEIDHAYLVQHNDALIAACDTARSRLAAAEGIIEAGKAENKRLVERVRELQGRLFAAESIIDDLKRQLEPLTEEEAIEITRCGGTKALELCSVDVLTVMADVGAYRARRGE